MKNVIHKIIFVLFFFFILIITIIPKLLVCLWTWEPLMHNKPNEIEYFGCMADLIESIIGSPED